MNRVAYDLRLDEYSMKKLEIVLREELFFAVNRRLVLPVNETFYFWYRYRLSRWLAAADQRRLLARVVKLFKVLASRKFHAIAASLNWMPLL